MKKLLGLMICFFVGVVLTLGQTGCTSKGDKDKDKKKPDGAGAGTKDKDKDKDKKIEVSADPDKATVKQGEETSVKITLKRGKEATKEAKLTVGVEPKDKGLTATVDELVKGDKSEATLKIKAGADAAKGEATVTVWVKSEGSPDADVKVSVKVAEAKAVVEAKTDMKLAIAEGKAVKIKQGDKAYETKLAVTLGKDLKAAAVKAEVKGPKADSKGVTVAVAPEKMEKSGDATVTITVADTAAEGDWEVTITAAGEGAMPPMVTSKIMVTVEKKK